MSIEKMQDEFEAWVLSEYENQHMGKFATGEYHSTTVQFCWLSWQASRAALVTNESKVIAQRLREYNHNAHHINPVSDAFHVLIDEAAEALSKGLAACLLTEEILGAAYWDFDARIKGYAPYGVPSGNQVHAFKTAVFAAIEAAGVKVKP